MQADPLAQARQLLAAGRTAEARQLLERTAVAGDRTAAASLAEALLTGWPFGRDLEQSRHWYARAAQLGDDNARDVSIAFLANGTGAARDWQAALSQLRKHADRVPDYARQLELLEAMDLDDQGCPAARAAGKAIPQMEGARHLRAFLTRSECAYLIDLSQPHFQPSQVVDQATGKFIADPIRQSDVAPYPLAAERPVIHAINQRIANSTDTQVGQGEPLQVLRYAPGQHYKQHMDALPNADNQRALTFLIYLNADYEGGETLFPKADLQFRGAAGDALLFRNTTKSGEPDPRSVHIGMPVTSGTKFLASRWIRDRPLDLTR